MGNSIGRYIIWYLPSASEFHCITRTLPSALPSLPVPPSEFEPTSNHSRGNSAIAAVEPRPIQATPLEVHSMAASEVAVRVSEACEAGEKFVEVFYKTLDKQRQVRCRVLVATQPARVQ